MAPERIRAANAGAGRLVPIRRLILRLSGFFLDFHVPELIGVEHLSAVLAFDEFDVVLA